MSNLAIRGCVVSDTLTHRMPAGCRILRLRLKKGLAAGIYLRHVQDSTIESTLVNNTFNGISLVRSERNVVRGNNTLLLRQRGIYLLCPATTRWGQHCRHCIRYTDRFWCDTADSAGILLEHGSHRNRITGNSLRYSGDGFFIRAHNRPPSNDNFIAGNDAAIRPTTPLKRCFHRATCSWQHRQLFQLWFWLGYSTDTTVRGNETRQPVRRDRHRARRDNRIEDNRIVGNRNGIRLWSDAVAEGRTMEAARVDTSSQVSD